MLSASVYDALSDQKLFEAESLGEHHLVAFYLSIDDYLENRTR